MKSKARLHSASRAAMGAAPASRGFTLIELMLVLVIMTTLSAAIVPSLASALRRTGLGAAGNKLCELFNFAYMSAVARRRPVVVNLDADHARCWVTMRTVSLPWLPDQETPETLTLASMELPEGTQLVVTRGESEGLEPMGSQVWETISFRSDGGTEDAIIELTSREGEVFEIEVFGATGQARVREES